VWNPWFAKANRLGDMGPDGWRRMVCVETCNAGSDIVQLQPGTSHTLSAEYRVSGI
jgi:glucose-6-phosphate 1-epimerase